MPKNQAKPITQYRCISELDSKQKSDIAVWLYEIYHDYYIQHHAVPTETEHHDEIIKKLIQKAKQEKICIPDKQIQIYYNSKQAHLLKRIKKEFPELSDE